MAERMAYFGLSVNMVAFMLYTMHLPFTSSANTVNNFLGISQASSVLGGFLVDAYLGRYWTIAIFTTIYLLGLTGITLCATMPIFVTDQTNCDKLATLLRTCAPAKSWQILYLKTVLYIAAFGAAGIRPCVSSFGADQFDERSPHYKSHLERFFNFFYLSVTIGNQSTSLFIRLILVVWRRFHDLVFFFFVINRCHNCIYHGCIHTNEAWVGFRFWLVGSCYGDLKCNIFVGTPLYRHRLPGGSPLTRVAQVLVAAFRKRNVLFSSSELVGLYEVAGKRSAIKGSGKLEYTDDFRLINQPSSWRVSVAAGQFRARNIGLVGCLGWCIREVFCIVGLLEFLYQEAPDAMRSVGFAYAAVAGGLGCFFATMLNNVINGLTGNEEEGKPSWLSQNINSGRFDYFYWLLTVLGMINFFVFLFSQSGTSIGLETQHRCKCYEAI